MMLSRLATIVTMLMALASGIGLLAPRVYRDNALVRAAWFGNDVVTLVVAVPLLGVAAWRLRHGEPRDHLIGLGLLAYALYNYAFYAFGAAFNALYLVYVGILVGATLGLIAGLTSAPVTAIASRVGAPPGHRGVGLLIGSIAGVLGAFWIAQAMWSAMTGDVPAMVAAVGHPTNVTGVLDLWLVVTFGLWGGLWLRSGRPWGYVIAVTWTIKGAVYMAALSAAAMAARWTGAAADLTQLALWVPIGVGCVVGALVLLKACPRTPVRTGDVSDARAPRSAKRD